MLFKIAPIAMNSKYFFSFTLLHQFQHLLRRIGDVGARAEDGGDAGFGEEIIVLRGDYAAADDENIAAPGVRSQTSSSITALSWTV